MFTHIFKMRIKCLLREKSNLFWILCFPILLATLFSFAFSSIIETTSFKAIDVAVTAHSNVPLEEMLTGLEDGESPLLSITYATTQQAESLLQNGEVVGIISYGEDGVALEVKREGISQTILKNVLDEFSQTSRVIATMIENDPTLLQGEFFWETRASFVNSEIISTNKADPVVINYHGLIAMACLFGGHFGIKCVGETQANQSAKGLRRNMVPVNKMKIFCYEFLAVTVVQISLMFIVLAYIIWGIQIDIGTKVPAIILTTIVSSILGISTGTLIGAIAYKSQKIAEGILVCGSLASCTLAGLMGFSMKYPIEVSMPVIKYINPANLISNAFGSLYAFDSYTRFGMNIALICIMSVFFVLISCFIIRRQRYESI